MRIKEVPIPTYYGGEICYVNGMKYARDVVRSIFRYRRTVLSAQCYPEYREFWQQYPVKSSRYSSHDYVRRWVGTGQRVLDVACGDGQLAEELTRAGNRVSGIDIVAEPKHAGIMEQYVRCDLADGMEPAVEQLGDARFDCILLMDILEHLPEPERVLRACRKLLAPQGQIIVSVPNIANVTIRARLLMGRFEYADRGILDRTHLRFYTRKSSRRLLRNTGYEITRQAMTNIPIELRFGLAPSHGFMRLAHHLLAGVTKLFGGLMGYQCVYSARSSASHAGD
jgi:2-polyprenyl-3-methyl-5-hydroxy-6-metoxy-1,4-benzoquinol methylase